jgi:ferric-dicitrate binding protein FerR (iron transport regulator)
MKIEDLLSEAGRVAMREASNHLPPNLPPDGRRIALEGIEYAVGFLLAELATTLQSAKPTKAKIKTKKGARVNVEIVDE